MINTKKPTKLTIFFRFFSNHFFIFFKLKSLVYKFCRIISGTIFAPDQHDQKQANPDKPSENKLRITNHTNFVDIQGNQIGVDLTFDKPHRVFLQDISQKNPKISLVAYDIDGEKIWEKNHKQD